MEEYIWPDLGIDYIITEGYYCTCIYKFRNVINDISYPVEVVGVLSFHFVDLISLWKLSD